MNVVWEVKTEIMSRPIRLRYIAIVSKVIRRIKIEYEG